MFLNDAFFSLFLFLNISNQFLQILNLLHFRVAGLVWAFISPSRERFLFPKILKATGIEYAAYQLQRVRLKHRTYSGLGFLCLSFVHFPSLQDCNK
jgi:hypothetical protein